MKETVTNRMMKTKDHSHVMSHIGVPWQGITMTAVRGSRQQLIRSSSSTKEDASRRSTAGTTCDEADTDGYIENFIRHSWSRASCISRLFVLWMFPILWRGSKKTLCADDFPISLVPCQYQPKHLSGIVKSDIRRHNSARSGNKTHGAGTLRRKHRGLEKDENNGGCWSTDGKIWIAQPYRDDSVDYHGKNALIGGKSQKSKYNSNLPGVVGKKL